MSIRRQVGIIMDSMRSQAVKEYRFPVTQAIMLRLGGKFLVTHIDLLRYLMTLMRVLQRLGIEHLVKHLPRPLSELDYLMPSSSSPKLYYPKIPEIIKPPGRRKYRIGFLHGCLMEAALPWVNRALIRVLIANECEVVTPRSQTCCGAASMHEGFIDHAKKLAKNNIDAFENFDVDYIVASASGCVATLKMYDELLKNDPKYEKSKRIQKEGKRSQ